MSTMNISLPESLKDFVDEQVQKRGFSTSSEYIRELIRNDQIWQGEQRLAALLLEGLESGPAIPVNEAYWNGKRDAEIDALADYIAQDSLTAAFRFLDAVQKTFDLIGEQPGIGPRRFAHLPLLEALRVWPVADFEKHLVFYIERPGYIDVPRVLHGARDIPVVLGEGSDAVD